jgi:glutathione S-transferase
VKLYHVPKTRSQRPRWVLEELGLPHELVRLDPSRGETRTPEHRARHPLGHVPVLEDGATRIHESAAICLWLSERYGEGRLLPPPATPERAQVYQWLFYAMSELEPPLIQAWAELRRPEPERDPARLAEAKRGFGEAAAAVDRALQGREWLVGSFGVADVVVGSCLLWGRSVRLLEGLPAAEAWCRRLRERPAWKRSAAD